MRACQLRDLKGREWRSAWKRGREGEREKERTHAGEEERESVFHISKLLTVNLLKVLITHIPIFYMVTC